MAGVADLVGMTDRRPRRAYWVMGHPTLREEVVEILRSQVGAAPENTTATSGTDATATWDAVMATGLDPDAPRLTVVRDAEKLGSLDVLRDWLDNRSVRGATVILVSSLESWEPGRWRKGDDPHRPEERALFAGGRSTTLLVDARLPDTEAGRRAAADLVQHWAPDLRPGQAERILEACDMDITAARDAAMKAAIFRRPLPNKVVDLLTSPPPSTEFVRSLTELRRADAATASLSVPPEDVGRTIGLLEWNLDMLGRLQRATMGQEPVHVIAARAGVQKFIADRLARHARHYDRTSVTRRTLLLAEADAANERRVGEGVLANLAMRW